VEELTPELLETFPYEYAGRDAVVEISTDEFTCVCPFSGLPDFGTLTVRYVPRASCLELKSLKYYLTSFRSVGIYQEHAANRILDDLVARCDPKWMELSLDYRLRGGIHTVVTSATAAAESGEPGTVLAQSTLEALQLDGDRQVGEVLPAGAALRGWSGKVWLTPVQLLAEFALLLIPTERSTMPSASLSTQAIVTGPNSTIPSVPDSRSPQSSSIS